MPFSILAFQVRFTAHYLSQSHTYIYSAVLGICLQDYFIECLFSRKTTKFENISEIITEN